MEIELLFSALKIIQIADNQNRKNKGLKPLGNGYSKAYRMNPFNPLSYIILLIFIPYSFVFYGLMGFKTRYKNPFKWD